MKKIIWLIILLVLLAGLLWWDSARKDNSGAAGNIKIGVLAPLSGEAGAWGENAKMGIDLAVAEFEKDSGRDVEIVYEDTGADAKRAVAGLQKFISLDKVNAVIGPMLQTEVSAVAPIIAQKNIPVVTPSYAPARNRPNLKNPVVIWMDPTAQSERMATHVAGQGIKTVGIIGTKDSWEDEVTSAFAKKAQELGVRVVGSEIVQPDAADMRLSVTKLISQKPDAIFLGTYYQFVNSVTALNQLGYKGKLYSIEVDSYLAEQTAERIDLMQFIAPDFYDSLFVTNFEKTYSKKPGIPAGQAYDAAKLLLSVLKDETDPVKVIEKFSKIDSYKGVSGEARFTADGKSFLPTALFELQKGEVSRIMELK